MWQDTKDGLYKKFKFADFNEAFAFMSRVAILAESQHHHPRWQNEWNRVEIWLSTHDVGGRVTDKDRTLAKAIDALVGRQTQELSQKSQFKAIKLYADGGSRGNPGPSATGYVLLDPDGNVIKKSGVYLGITTNNQAEYHALKQGLEEAHRAGASEIAVFMDSLLVINQMKGIFKIRNRDLWPVHDAIKTLVKQFHKVTFTHVPRELNKLADAEVNEVLDAAT